MINISSSCTCAAKLKNATGMFWDKQSGQGRCCSPCTSGITDPVVSKRTVLPQAYAYFPSVLLHVQDPLCARDWQFIS